MKDILYIDEAMEAGREECLTCKFWRSSFNGDRKASRYGTCHRRAPLSEGKIRIEEMWPKTDKTYWCGDWQLVNLQNDLTQFQET